MMRLAGNRCGPLCLETSWGLARRFYPAKARSRGFGSPRPRGRAYCHFRVEPLPPQELKLICIPPDQALLIWPRVSDLIYAAMRRGGITSFQGIRDDVLTGRALLWIVYDGTIIHAAVVTEIFATDWNKIGMIVACGGADRDRWLGFLAAIEDYFRAEGCAISRVMGRKGWQSVLSDYSCTRVILDKKL